MRPGGPQREVEMSEGTATPSERVEPVGEDPETDEESGVEEFETSTALSADELEQLDERSLAEADEQAELGDRSAIEGLEAEDDERRAAGQLRVSPHFRLAEFHCKDGTPVPAGAIPALRRLARDVLEPLRAEFGVCTVVSGYRTAFWNRRVGGKPKSRHRYDMFPAQVASDLQFATGTPRQWANTAERVLHGSGGLGLYSTFIHVDIRPFRARW